MRYSRPENLAVLMLIAGITALLLLANVFWTRQGSPLDVGTLRRDDAYSIADRRAREDFGGKEAAYVLLRYPDGIATTSDIERLRTLHGALAERLEPLDITVSSIANMPCYKDIDDTLYTNHCADLRSPVFQRHGAFSLDLWRERIKHDRGIYPLFVGRDFSYAAIYFFPPDGMDEVDFAVALVEAIEGHDFSLLHYYFKDDIVPADPDALISGWIVIRWLITGALNTAMAKTVPFGILLATIALFFITGSLRRALLISLGVITLSIIWTRGEIGVLEACASELLGFETRERVYALLAYTNCIVQGISFPVHLHFAYEQHRRLEPGLSWAELWRRAVNDVRPLLTLVASIAIFGFLSLYVFNLQSIRELGIISACGVLNVWLLARFLVPAADMLRRSDEAPVRHGHPPASAAAGRDVLAGISALCLRAIGLVPPRWQWAASVGATALAVLAAFSLWQSGLLKVGTQARGYIRDTHPDHVAEYMNTAGKPGMDVYNLFVKPRTQEGDEALSSPKFIREVTAFGAEVSKLDLVREVHGVHSTIAHLSHESWKERLQPLPETVDEANAVLFLIEEGIPETQRAQMYNDKGVRILVSTSADGTNTIGRLAHEITAVARGYPTLLVLPFGKVATYASSDREILLGKPLNMVAGQWIIMVLCAIWIYATLSKADVARSRALAAAGKGGVVLSVPFVFATGAILVVMMLGRVPLDTATAAIGPISINASIDFAIYYAYFYIGERLRRRDHQDAQVLAMQAEGPAVTADCMLNIMCFVPLVLFGTFVPVERLGWMMCVMLFCAWLGALIVMPPLLRWAFRGV